jgi:hypothetical protein
VTLADYLALVASLEKSLDGRQTELAMLDAYYQGRQPLLLATDKWRGLFGRLFAGFSDNFLALVVDAVEERLTVQGFRMGIDKDTKADEDAWRIWQVNQLDAWSQVAHTEALVKATSYIGVSPFRDDWPADDSPLITIEDACEVIVRGSSMQRGKRLAALKKWKDDDGRWLATLYLPGEVVKFQQSRILRFANQYSRDYVLGGWEPRQIAGEAWPLPNPLGIVPIIPLVNRPRLRGNGESEIIDLIPIQNALNKTLMDMLVAAEYAAFRQKWASGIEIPEDPVTHKPIGSYESEITRFISTAVPDARFGSFEATDLKPFVAAIETFIQHMASRSHTPPHYLLGQSGSFPSGESLKATETGLVAKARRKQRHFGEAWEEAVRLAFRALDDPRGLIIDSETIWADPESRTEAEHVDALVKMASLGVPDEVLWERWGATPTEIARWKTIQAEDALLRPEPSPSLKPLAAVTVGTPTANEATVVSAKPAA